MQCFTPTTESPSIAATSTAFAPPTSSTDAAIAAWNAAGGGDIITSGDGAGVGDGVRGSGGIGAAASATITAGSAIASSIRESPSVIVSPLCSFALLIFWPLTNVPRVEPRSMRLTSGPVTSTIACMRLTDSSSIRRCADGTLPILITRLRQLAPRGRAGRS